LSEPKKYRKFAAQQKAEIVLASLRGPKTMAELCRERSHWARITAPRLRHGRSERV
jgi:hypothetical protein